MDSVIALLGAIGTLISALAPVASAVMGVVIIIQQMKHGATLKQLTGVTNGIVSDPAQNHL